MSGVTSGRITSYEHDGLVFDVLDEGPVDGEVVVLLHGFPERATCWREVAPPLHDAGYRTLAPDQRGYSRGARPKGRRAYRVDLLAGDVARLLELAGGAEGRTAHLVGHDWGAIVGWAVAQRRPDLLRSWTAVSVPHPAAYAQALTSSRQGLRSWYMLAFQLPWLPERLAAAGRLDPLLRRGGMSKADVERFHREVEQDGALPGGLAWYRALPFADRASIGARVHVPTTMVWSDRDGFLDRAGAELTGRFVKADYDLVVLEGVTHWIPTHAPEQLAAAILARATAPAS